jgi:hypothetical protein
VSQLQHCKMETYRNTWTLFTSFHCRSLAPGPSGASTPAMVSRLPGASPGAIESIHLHGYLLGPTHVASDCIMFTIIWTRSNIFRTCPTDKLVFINSSPCVSNIRCPITSVITHLRSS